MIYVNVLYLSTAPADDFTSWHYWFSALPRKGDIVYLHERTKGKEQGEEHAVVVEGITWRQEGPELVDSGTGTRSMRPTLLVLDYEPNKTKRKPTKTNKEQPCSTEKK